MTTMTSSRLAARVIPLTVRMADREDFCTHKFCVKLIKSEKYSYEHRLSVGQIRTLLYLKALQANPTSVAQVADDLLLSRIEVISAIQKLRKEGFVTDLPAGVRKTLS